MELENLIVSKYNEDIEYTFDDMLLDEKDETVESDIHIIDIFGKPYSIAMGNLHKPDEDETLGYFICYLLYEKQVVRKLGLYEISLASNEMASINHRTFDFEKEKLLLFDEYYEDITKLHPYMHKNKKNVTKQVKSKATDKRRPPFDTAVPSTASLMHFQNRVYTIQKTL